MPPGADVAESKQQNHSIKITINFKTVLDHSQIHVIQQDSDSALYTELANQTTMQVVSLFSYEQGTRNIVTCLLLFLHSSMANHFA